MSVKISEVSTVDSQSALLMKIENELEKREPACFSFSLTAPHGLRCSTLLHRVGHGVSVLPAADHNHFTQATSEDGEQAIMFPANERKERAY